MADPIEERITELEVRFSFLKNETEALDSVIQEQQRAIEKLNREMALLKEQIAQSGGIEAGQEKPPHY